MLLRINQDVLPSDCAKLIEQASRAGVGSQVLLMASKRKFAGALFREACALEAVIHLLRARRLDVVRTYIPADTQTLPLALEEFVSQPSNYAAALHASRLEFANGAVIDAASVSKLLEDRDAQNQNLDELASRIGVSGVDLVSSYQTPNLLFPRALYFRPTQGELSVERLDKLAARCLQSSSAETAARWSELFAALIDPVRAMLREVYENTDRHALTEIDGEPITHGVRGLSVRRLSIDREKVTFESLFPEAPQPMRLTVSAWSKRFAEKSAHIVEITVFDSGPGFAERFTRKKTEDLSLDAEYDAVETCFLEGASSALVRGRGKGLAEVAKIVALQCGVLRLRTGRTCIYAPYRDDTQNRPVETRFTRLPGRVALPQLRGSIVSILIPVFATS